MGVNRGKQFEAAIKSAASSVSGVSIDRLADPASGYAGIKNICDFILYQYPYQSYIECKAISVATLNFKHHISENQWIGLLEKSKIRGVAAGILVWYIEEDRTLFIPIQTLEQMRSEGYKSFSIKTIPDVHYIEVYGEKKRVLFTYHFSKFLDDLGIWIREYGDGK